MTYLGAVRAASAPEQLETREEGLVAGQARGLQTGLALGLTLGGVDKQLPRQQQATVCGGGEGATSVTASGDVSIQDTNR